MHSLLNPVAHTALAATYLFIATNEPEKHEQL